MTPSLRKRAQQLGERVLFRPAQTGGRLVEDDQRRIGGKRARDFENALAAERQIAGEVVGLGAEPDALELAQRLETRARFLGRDRAATRRRESPRGCADRRRAATLSISDMLERSFTC